METEVKIAVPNFIRKHKQFSGLFRQYQDSFLVIDSITDQDVILLSILIVDDWRGKRGSPDLNALKALFSYLGRNIGNFWYNRTRLSKQGLVDESDGNFFITTKGLRVLEQDAGIIENTSVHIIKERENFTAVDLFKNIIIGLPKADRLMLMDEHISHQTLLPFVAIKNRVSFFDIITSNVHEDKKDFYSYIDKFEKETGAKINVKISHKSHDRILIAGDKCLEIGSSIKDLGNKDTIITDISVVGASMKYLFEERWAEAETYK